MLDSREQVLSTVDSDDINPVEYSSFTVMNRITLLGALIHFLFLVSFYFFGVKELVWFNIGSCILYGISYFLNRNGYYNLVLFLVNSEIVLHSCLAVYYIGWATGFHYYTIVVAPIIFLSALESKMIKLLSTAVIAVIYSGLAFYAELADPVYLLSEPIIKIFKYSNIVALFFTISHPSYYYNSAVIKTRRKLNNLNQQLKILAATDSLTKLLNRWAMNKRMKKEVKRLQNEETHFVLILTDIDDFKWVNDQYGHDCGDFILQELAQLMEKELIGQGLVSRWGGEEFLLFLEDTNLKQGVAFSEKLREEIASYPFNYEGQKIDITMTFGVSEYDEGSDLKETIKRADQALYKGKGNGKNKVVSN